MCGEVAQSGFGYLRQATSHCHVAECREVVCRNASYRRGNPRAPASALGSGPNRGK